MHVCIVVGGWATDSGLEKRIGSAGRGAGVGIVVDAFATCSGHEKRSGSTVATQVEVHV